MGLAYGVGISPVFGGYSSPYLWYWECPQTPGILAPSAVLPSWLTYTRASSQDSVQIGSALVSTDNASAYDTCPVGRALDSHKLSLILDPTAVNGFANSRTLVSPWSGGSGETFVAQSAGTDSPDGKYNAVELSCISGGYARYRSFVPVTGTKYSFQFWAKKLGSYINRRGLLSDTTGGNGVKESGARSTAWEHVILAYTSSAGALAYGIPVYGANSFPVGAPFTSEAAGAKIDFAMQCALGHRTEWHLGTRANSSLLTNVGFNPIGADGVLRLYMAGYLRFSPGSLINALTYHSRLLYGNATNYLLFNGYGALAPTPILKIGGTDVTLSGGTGLAGNMDDYAELYFELGGSSHKFRYRINGGAMVNGGNSSTTANWSSSLQYYIASLSGTSSHFPFALHKIGGFLPGRRPDWVTS